MERTLSFLRRESRCSANASSNSLPPPEGPFQVGYVDIMTHGTPDQGVFFRLHYPAPAHTKVSCDWLTQIILSSDWFRSALLQSGPTQRPNTASQTLFRPWLGTGQPGSTTQSSFSCQQPRRSSTPKHLCPSSSLVGRH